MEAQGNKIWYYKGNPYKVLGACKVKDLTTRTWYDAVMYRRADDAPNKNEVYIRERNEFYQRFK